MSWHLKCNNKKFVDKIETIKEQISSGMGMYFCAPPSYEQYDFSKEPNKSMEELCKTKAQSLRTNYEKLILYYSGGCDSHYILQTFIDNDIKLDGLVMVKSGFKKADFEIDQYAIPFAKKTGIDYTVRQPDMKYYHDYYVEGLPMIGTANNMWHHFRLNNHFENLQKFNNNTGNIFGKEKTKLYHMNNKWYAFFLDVEVTPQPNQINFYCDDPEIYAKQSHMVMKEIIKHKEPNTYNFITYCNEHQNFWNKSMGRYEDCHFPLKELEIGQHFNNKDKLALASADDKLIKGWRNKNQKLIEDIGKHYFNQGDPALGTVGVFSKFYGITTNETKNVDELFPNGFKIQ